MQRVLILYATREGQTEKVARRIAEHLQEYGETVELLNARDEAAREVEVDSFDLERISRQERSFFLVLLSAATKDAALRECSLADARAKMNRQLAVRFDDVEIVAGALRYSKYSAPLKWLMRRIAESSARMRRRSEMLLGGTNGEPPL